ncbi:MAG: alpha-mannosidase [Candidatus Hydrogenedens sp.]|nr:alpha-mannosidase [Candidatus Hydrogenedens sp.]
MAVFDADWKTEFMQLRARLDELRGRVFSDCRPMGDLWRCVTGPGKGPEGIPASGWSAFQPMERWGHYDQTTWFRMRAVVPKEFAGKRVVALLNPCAYTDIPGIGPHDESGEALAYVNGKPFQGIDRHHDFMVLAEKGRAGDAYDIALEACPSTRFDATHVFARAETAVMHRDVWDLYWDGAVLLDLIGHLPEQAAARKRLLRLAHDAVCMADLRLGETPEFHASVAAARAFLKKGLKRFPAGPDAGRLALIGHSHIDTAWLWPLRETRRKVGRTFSTVLRLMEQYPEYHFSASQPELYMFVKENHPEIWKGIRRRVKEGRWEPCGAPWVEQDSQMPCGEALVRQFLYGNRFFEKEFGRRTRTAWLPDAFGFPWSLPQIMAKAQLDTFYTIKLTWNRYTRFPHGYFWWQGADGTRIRACIPPLNYNGDPVPAQLSAQWERFPQRDLVDEVPFSFGWGDGGGGPSPRMLEYGKRMKNIAGMPRCEFGRTQDCLDRMRAQAPDDALPVWNGELYLELHRACQTTQARTKRNNRKCEWLLHNAELLSVWAMLHGGAYEQGELAAAWRVLLTHQFHDILPGSSITEVYRDADAHYAALRLRVEGVLQRAACHLAARTALPGAGVPVIVWNTLSVERHDPVMVRAALPDGPCHVVAADGTEVPSQCAGPDTLLFAPQSVPPMGHAVFRIVGGAGKKAPNTLKATTKKLENELVRVTLDDHGRFTSVFDKRLGREALAPGEKGNVLQLFDDRPGEHDAWDIDYNFADRMWEPGPAEFLEVIETGPVRAVVRVARRSEKASFEQDIVLHAGSARIDVVNRVHWHEKRTLLKVAFPVDVLSPRAAFDIQFAAVERATHENTDYDRARFEVTAHHWADLSEDGFGVSLLNDCKYGYDVRGNVLRLSLLRGAVEPDPVADEGHHEFTYALLPHAGDWRGDTLREGLMLNQPPLAMAAPPAAGRAALPPVASLVRVEPDRAVVDTVKRAEDGDAVIVRLHEARGGRGPVTVSFLMPPKSVCECDLMEENDQPLDMADSFSVDLGLTPFEIRTLKVVF